MSSFAEDLIPSLPILRLDNEPDEIEPLGTLDSGESSRLVYIDVFTQQGRVHQCQETPY